MTSRTYFFATASDLLPVVTAAEAQMSIQYVLTGLFESPKLTTSHRAADIPGFAVAVADDMNLLPHYLVAQRSADIRVRPVPQRKGGTRYAVDQLVNAGTIEFTPGGVNGDRAVISGRVASVHSDPVAAALLQVFGRGIKKFRRVRSYYVGPEAERLWQSGHRLTASLHSPREYNLSA